jgi:hypothetical protein
MDHDFFVHEDLSKSENRINVAIFGLLADPTFRRWFQARLGLPENSVLYPPKNATSEEGTGTGRPDFKVTLGDEIIAWIEVECGEDAIQLGRFRQLYRPVPALAIWGRKSFGADLSLEELSDFLAQPHANWDPNGQVAFNVRYLQVMIEEVLHGNVNRAAPRTQVSDLMRDTPFLRDLETALEGRLSFALSGNMRPGEIRADTTKPHGYSIRLYSQRSNQNRSVSVLFRSGGQDQIGFPSEAKLHAYLPRRQSEVRAYAAYVDSIGGSMGNVALEWSIVRSTGRGRCACG